MLSLRCSDTLGPPKDVPKLGKHRLVIFYLTLPNEDLCGWLWLLHFVPSTYTSICSITGVLDDLQGYMHPWVASSGCLLPELASVCIDSSGIFIFFFPQGFKVQGQVWGPANTGEWLGHLRLEKLLSASICLPLGTLSVLLISSSSPSCLHNLLGLRRPIAYLTMGSEGLI